MVGAATIRSDLRAAGRMKIGGRHETAFNVVWERPRRARFEVMSRGKRSLVVLDGDQGWLVATLLGWAEPMPIPPDGSERS